jgi:HD-GYP domain-containing protein (c-di-GMP phosphodiesterase class II)
MDLISLPIERVEFEETLPFDLFDAQGRLLLAANQSLQDPAVLQRLRMRGELFAEAGPIAAWHPAAAQPSELLVQDHATLAAEPGWEWKGLVQMADVALRQPKPGSPWLERVHELHARMRSLSLQRLDEALFHFIYQGARHVDDYSCHQALRCALIAGAVARTLGWDAALVEAVEKAALTMNVSMRPLQDQLASQADAHIDPDTRKRIVRHSLDSAKLLLASGVEDRLWLDAVLLHHDGTLEGLPLEQLSPGKRLALLLHRVDVYSAVLSRRATRSALTPTQAARKACLGPDGRPDVMGAALLKTMGLYPPGSFVQLDTQEIGVVLSRGRNASQPLVAVLVSSWGEALAEPRLRDTSQLGCAVCTGLQPDQVEMEPAAATWAVLHRLARKLRATM